MDDSAVPRISDVRSSVPIRHPRPRCNFLVGLGRGAEGLRRQSSVDTLSSAQANTHCERLVGTIRRECLDFLILLSEAHLKRILREFVRHFNRGRPHSALGPGIPEPPQVRILAGVHRHKLPTGFCVKSTPVLGGLHHEYSLEKRAA